MVSFKGHHHSEIKHDSCLLGKVNSSCHFGFASNVSTPGNWVMNYILNHIIWVSRHSLPVLLGPRELSLTADMHLTLILSCLNFFLLWSQALCSHRGLGLSVRPFQSVHGTVKCLKIKEKPTASCDLPTDSTFHGFSQTFNNMKVRGINMALIILSGILYSVHKMIHTIKKYQLVFYQVCGII